MKKHIVKQQILATVLSAAMIMGSAVPAMAADQSSGTDTLTTENPVVSEETQETLKSTGLNGAGESLPTNSRFTATLEYVVTAPNKVSVYSFGPNGSANAVVPSTVTYDDVTYTVTGIDSTAMVTVTNIETITVEAGVTDIGFSFCYSGGVSTSSALKSVTVNDPNATVKTVDGVVYSSDMKTIYCYPPAKEGDTFVLPADTNAIASYAFCLTTNLKKLILRDNITMEHDSISRISTALDIYFAGEIELEYGPISGYRISGLPTGSHVYFPTQASVDWANGAGILLDGVTATLGYVPVTGMVYSEPTATMSTGGSQTITYAKTPEYATEPVTWTSSNPSVLTVDANGNLKAIAEGTATITANTASLGDKMFPITVSAGIPVTSIAFSATALTVNVGDEIDLYGNTTTPGCSVTILPKNTTEPIAATDLRFVVSNESGPGVATVDAQGKLHANSEGTLNVTVSNTTGLVTSAPLSITITTASLPPLQEIRLSSETLEIAPGQRDRLLVTYIPENHSSSTDVQWSISDNTVASITQDGEITALKPGTATVTATGANNTSDTCEITVLPYTFAEVSAAISDITDQTFTGSDIEPVVTVKKGAENLVLNTDYTVAYTNNKNVGTATVTVTGKNNYSGTLTKDFKIVAKSIASATISAIFDQPFTGSNIEPAVTVQLDGKNLVANTDYSVAYSNNTSVGTATVTVTGKNNYSGILTKNFNIVTKSIASATISAIADHPFTGSQIRPAVTVQLDGKNLVADTDYSVAYSNNTSIGKATVTVTGKNNYSGTLTKDFNIVTKSIAAATISAIADQPFTGSQVRPAITVQLDGKNLVANTDYSVAYSNNTKVGTATVTVTGKNNYSGSLSKTFKIVSTTIAINDCTVADISAQTFTGSAASPVLTIIKGETPLVVNTDYTVSYANNTYPGTATVTITGKGTYTGTVTKTFPIEAEKTGLLTLDGKTYYAKTKTSLAKDEWITAANRLYYFSGDSVAATSWRTIDGNRYYFEETGTASYGWKKISGDWYWFSPSSTDCKMGFGWIENGGAKYYTDPNTGVVQTGWQKLDNQWYYFKTGDSGKMLTDWQKIDGGWFYLTPETGVMKTGWQKISGSWYYLKPGNSGRMLTGWQKIDGAWYYLTPGDSGAMKTGWQKINNKWYYFKTGDSGRMLTGWQKINGDWYYLRTGDDGSMVTGWLNEGGARYYLNSSGKMVTGRQTINGIRYTFASNGKLQ